jgi:hypothetical protein
LKSIFFTVMTAMFSFGTLNENCSTFHARSCHQ